MDQNSKLKLYPKGYNEWNHFIKFNHMEEYLKEFNCLATNKAGVLIYKINPNERGIEMMELPYMGV